MNERHDHAVAISRHVLEVFAPMLREEERREALAEVYARVAAGLRSFEVHTQRERHRLSPSEN